MRDLRIALLNASHRDENATRNFRRELDASLAEFDVTSGQLPASFEYDAVVVTGSRSSVYWDDAWIPPTKVWVTDAIDRGLPCLGICWGHQLLADVLGGEVRDMGDYEIGYRQVERTGRDSRLFDGIDRSFTAFTTHSDEVAELPPGAEELARNDYSNHGFRLGRVFGVQFHPEYDAKSARDLTMSKDLTDEHRERVLAGITDENVERACDAKRVFDNFLSFVADVRTGTVEGSAPSRDAGPDSSEADGTPSEATVARAATTDEATTADGTATTTDGTATADAATVDEATTAESPSDTTTPESPANPPTDARTATTDAGSSAVDDRVSDD